LAETLKRLGATTVVADTNTSLYQVPTGKSAVVSSIVVCNRGSTDRTFRVAHVDAAIASVASEDYVAYDGSIEANGTVSLSLGIAMESGHSLLVRANHADVNFIAWGSEIT
jgi:hypothetical protein